MISMDIAQKRKKNCNREYQIAKANEINERACFIHTRSILNVFSKINSTESKKGKGKREREREEENSRFISYLPPKMPQLSTLAMFVSVVSLFSSVTSRPAGKDRFNLIQDGEYLPLPDFSLSLNDDKFMEEPLPLPESSFESTEPLLPSSFSGAINTAFTFGSDLDPDSPSYTLFDFSSTSFSSSPFPFQIADATLCPGENRYAFCCKGEKCVKTAKCYTDEDLNCCTEDPGKNDDKTPYDCQPPSSPAPQGLQILPGSPSELDSSFHKDFSSEYLSNFPGNFPVDTPQEPENSY